MTAPLIWDWSWGASAFSASRLERVLAKLRRHQPHISSVAADWLYLTSWNHQPTVEDRARHSELLGTPRTGVSASNAGVRLCVIPRLGTISPWSSKATDIAAICGLSAVQRLERGIVWTIDGRVDDANAVRRELHDRMTETVIAFEDVATLAHIFQQQKPRPMDVISLGSSPRMAIAKVSADLGLALAVDEIDYLAVRYRELGRAPTDVELMMFAQANSEHCRHKIFNATFAVDGEAQKQSLFGMIKNSFAAHPGGVLSAYKDNAAIVQGVSKDGAMLDAGRIWPDADGVYRVHREPALILAKVETHNHPTAIAPFAGAATGSGGEIRDEGATGRGGKPKAGLTGFTVSNLRIPGAHEPWEVAERKPSHIASPLDIMIEGPLGAAAFNNEVGRPSITGFFRTFEQHVPGDAADVTRGYHKPVMLAGGIGNVRPGHVEKNGVAVGAPLIVLGGPAMLIGLGGGAASSVTQGSQRADLDFASVQRDNAEMERRCQEVIDRCWAQGTRNPIASIHDVGAGGLSNALPEIVHDGGRGARLQLRKIPSAETGMSPRELWCNEAQERYVIALDADRVEEFAAICARERAPWAIVGHATEEEHLFLGDETLGAPAVDLPLDVLFGKPPRMHREVKATPPNAAPLDLTGVNFADALDRVLSLPAVADKSFLITIGDRTVGGLVARDQFVGPHQVAVADCGITLAGFEGFTGEAFAMGERPAVALLDAAASARLAIAEAILNLAGAPIGDISNIKLSCNWMAAAGVDGEDARLYSAVKAASEFAVELGIAIPVGKDSMSMRTAWSDGAGKHSVASPVTLVATAFAPVTDVRRARTPLIPDVDVACLLLLQPARKEPKPKLTLTSIRQAPIGASALAQAYGQLGDAVPDVDAKDFAKLWNALQELVASDIAFACHDISDGGLVVAAIEMAIASRRALELSTIDADGVFEHFFSEGPGVLIAFEASDAHTTRVREICTRHGVSSAVFGSSERGERVQVDGGLEDGWEALNEGAQRFADGRNIHRTILDTTLSSLRAKWSKVSHQIARLRDEPTCADEEHALRLDPKAIGLTAHVPFDMNDDIAAPFIARGARPRVAILREQGVNGQIEMAAAFTRAGFEAVDVHMTDLITGRDDLTTFHGVVACGGFSYGDVLGAGQGWAKSVLFNPRARVALERHFRRKDSFSLGVCNGCQMMSGLRDIIPGAESWPRFLRNRSEQFEARVSMVELLPSPSIFFTGMHGARIPIAVSHGEGRVHFDRAVAATAAARFVDGNGAVATRYPTNPNGSTDGLTAFTTPDGRATIMMPHPERVFRTAQLSWHPADWGEDSPWMRMFRNARAWVG